MNPRKLLRGEGEGANETHWRQEFVLEHRGRTHKVCNHRFIIDLLGVRPRRWESEVLSN